MSDFIKTRREHLKKYLVALAQKQNNRMLNQLLSAQPSALRPRLTLSVVLALLIATFVHLISVLLVIAGLYLIVIYRFNPFSLLFAFMCFGIAWLMRPEFGKPPKEYLT